MRAKADGRLANGGSIEITLEESDGEALIPGWADLHLGERWRALSDRADLMIVEYMHRRNEISTQYLKQRVREIKAGHVEPPNE